MVPQSHRHTALVPPKPGSVPSLPYRCRRHQPAAGSSQCLLSASSPSRWDWDRWCPCYPLRHRACLHEPFGRAPAGNHLAHHPEPVGAAGGEPCPILPQGPPRFPSQLQPRQRMTPSAPRKHRSEHVPEAFQVLPPSPLAAIAFALASRTPRLPAASGKANSCLGCPFYNKFSPSNPAAQSHSHASCSRILYTSFFIMGKAVQGWLLGTSTGAAAARPGTAPRCSSGHKCCRVGTASPLRWGSSLQMTVYSLQDIPAYSLQDIPTCEETCLTLNFAGPAPPWSKIDLWVTHNFSDDENGGTK